MSYPLVQYDHNIDRPAMVMGPGNGFPAEFYRPFVDALGDDYHRVCPLPRPWWDGEDPQEFTSWHVFSDDLIEAVREYDLAPVVGIGHSMSGVVLCFAAAAHPELFRAIVLLDPVFLPRFWVRMMIILEKLGLQLNRRRIEGARRRRREWVSVEEAYAHFRKRSLFRRISDDVIRLYVEGITRPKPDGTGIELAYSPEWEAKIFGTPPYDEWAYPKRVSVPCLVLGGAESDVFVPTAVALWRKLRPDVPIQIIEDAGHLLPVEKKQQTAAAIHQFLANLPPKATK